MLCYAITVEVARWLLGCERLGRSAQRRHLADAADAHVAQLDGSGLSEIGRGRGE